jgi:propionate CoA-transferase
VDIEKDILAQMEFRPVIKGKVPLMDKRIFAEVPMGLRKDMLG